MLADFAAQSSFHVGIIMDGNGRWATRRGLPRAAGHKAGARAVRRMVEAAPDLGITMLTLYALSSDNLRRPPAEVAALFRLFAEYLAKERAHLIKEGIRVVVIGRRDRLPDPLVQAIEGAEAATAHGDRLTLRLAIDYSGRHEILRAAQDGTLGTMPDVDLLVRSGGEQRLSDFLLWECAYAELWFTDRLWPDVAKPDLAAAVADFRRRDRRFGRISA